MARVCSPARHATANPEGRPRQEAVADSPGRLFDRAGMPVDHELVHRTLAFEFERLRGREEVVLLTGGLPKVVAIGAMLRTGVARGLVIDGDAAAAVATLDLPP